VRFGKMVLILLGLQGERFDFVEVRILQGLGGRGLRSPKKLVGGANTTPGCFWQRVCNGKKMLGIARFTN
jgi:hypothetical protein